MCRHWNCSRRLLIPMAKMNIDWNLKAFEPVFPNFNAIPTTITKIIMVSYPDEFDGHLVHNSTVAFRVWRVKVLNNNFSQEPVTRSEQLTCPRVTAFSRTSLFLERFWREFWISFKFHKPVSKTYRLKNYIFCLLVTFKFPFWNFCTSNTLMDIWWRLYFRGRKCPKLVSKNAVK